MTRRTTAVSADGPPASGARAGRPRDPALDEAIIKATRNRLLTDGYSRMTFAQIASDAGVTRPTVYRRGASKLELVIDALDHGFRVQGEAYAWVDLTSLGPYESFLEAIRRIEPCYFNSDAIILQGNFTSEKARVPELLKILQEHAVEPRLKLLEDVLVELKSKGAIRADADVHTVATMCLGAYFGAFLRGEEDRSALADQMAATLWPGIAAESLT